MVANMCIPLIGQFHHTHKQKTGWSHQKTRIMSNSIIGKWDMKAFSFYLLRFCNYLFTMSPVTINKIFLDVCCKSARRDCKDNPLSPTSSNSTTLALLIYLPITGEESGKDAMSWCCKGLWSRFTCRWLVFTGVLKLRPSYSYRMPTKSTPWWDWDWAQYVPCRSNMVCNGFTHGKNGYPTLHFKCDKARNFYNAFMRNMFCTIQTMMCHARFYPYVGMMILLASALVMYVCVYVCMYVDVSHIRLVWHQGIWSYFSISTALCKKHNGICS